MIPKLKIKFLFFLSFLSVNFSACSCAKDAIAQEYLEADIVGIITIKSTYRSEIKDDSRIYKAKISFDKIYKGNEIEELTILGRIDSVSSGACERLVRTGEKYLILLNKNGTQLITLCSSIYSIDNYSLSFINDYKKQFDFLANNKDLFKGLKFINFHDISKKWDDLKKETTNEFEAVFKKKLKNRFGIYKVEIDNKNEIVKINTVKKIGLSEKKFLELIKKNITVDFRDRSPNSEYLLLLNF